MGYIDKLKSAIENKLYNYKAMLKRATPNSEDFYCCRARVALCEELLIEAKQILKDSTNEDLDFQTFAKEMDAVFALPSSVTENTESDPLNWEYAIARHFANFQKEQMMKDAIEGPFIRRNRHTKLNVLNGLDLTCDKLQGFKDGQKLKVIFVPVDNK